MRKVMMALVAVMLLTAIGCGNRKDKETSERLMASIAAEKVEQEKQRLVELLEKSLDETPIYGTLLGGVQIGMSNEEAAYQLSSIDSTLNVSAAGQQYRIKLRTIQKRNWTYGVEGDVTQVNDDPKAKSPYLVLADYYGKTYFADSAQRIEYEADVWLVRHNVCAHFYGRNGKSKVEMQNIPDADIVRRLIK